MAGCRESGIGLLMKAEVKEGQFAFISLVLC